MTRLTKERGAESCDLLAEVDALRAEAETLRAELAAAEKQRDALLKALRNIRSCDEGACECRDLAEAAIEEQERKAP